MQAINIRLMFAQLSRTSERSDVLAQQQQEKGNKKWAVIRYSVLKPNSPFHPALE